MKGHIPRSPAIVALVTALLAFAAPASAQTARERYATLHAREQQALERISEVGPDAPAATRDAVMKEARAAIAGYDAFVRRFPSSGYADNALWNAATIADALFARYARAVDKAAADRYSRRLAMEYPTSSLLKRERRVAAARESRGNVGGGSSPSAASPEPRVDIGATSPSRATLTGIERTVLPEGVRVTLSLDREVMYREEKLDGPARVFFDLKDVETTPELKDAVLRYTNDGIRQIRIGRHPNNTVRVVLDMEGIIKHSVFTLYSPFRLVIDAEPASAHALAPSSGVASSASARATIPASSSVASAIAAPPTPVAARPANAGEGGVVPPKPAPISGGETPPAAAPTSPSANTAGGFSLSRQLGLGVSRIVVDAGHGGHDPGAQARGLNEADLTLDVALRLETLLRAEGLEVVLTRRENVYVPLEERTAIANREGADLFLSIHANASRSEVARGVETYFLSFASSPDAEAVAARENSASGGDMHKLPDIIKAIALNNKLDESRDFAGMVQEALVARLRRSNRNLRNLGVKKAPFVVLIGASMPSALAEISFLTNRQELQLLKTTAYKQRIAEALHASIMRYRRSLKGQGQIAIQ